MRHDRRCFGRLEQEDQRLKKHYSRWMDIVRSLEPESYILTKLTKPTVPVNLVGPQVSLRNGAPQMSGDESFFACNKEAFPCVWLWTQLSASPRTVLFRWKSFLDHVDHAARKA